jgi:hypothetical protein
MSTLSLNVGNFITLKLTPTNYPLWREQALSLAEGQDLVEHLTIEIIAPDKYIVSHLLAFTTSWCSRNKSKTICKCS